MKRREFITLLGGAAVAWPLAARAQQPERVRRIGVLMHVEADDQEGQDRISAFRQGLQQLGWIDRHNMQFDTRWGGNDVDRRRYAAELVAHDPEVILASTTLAMVALQRTTSAVPIVFANVEAARGLGLQLVFLNASNEREIDAAFTTLVQRRLGALLLTDTPLFNARREQLVTLARFNAIPTMYTFREFAVSGGLISYASSITDATRRSGVYVARILKGEKPGDLPIQLPTKLELLINLKTAKALGIDAPPALLALADEVIE